ncbi:hypothetical protein [Roseivirga sp.]|uniref:hypothetical protein n=1 Tax=Roseivirga sp. TaxID=1964215 RepID=UPI003B8CC5A0
MKNKFMSILMLALALSFLVLFMFEQSNKTRISEDYDLLKYEHMVGSFINSKLSNNLIRSKDFYTSNPDFGNIELLGENGMPLTMKSVLKRDYTIFFRYTELGCNTCTEEVIKLLNSSNLELEYLSTYQSKTYLNTFKRMNGIEQVVYNVPLSQELFPLDSLNIPYFFVVDKFGKVVDAHIPIKEDLKYTEEFITRVM